MSFSASYLPYNTGIDWLLWEKKPSHNGVNQYSNGLEEKCNTVDVSWTSVLCDLQKNYLCDTKMWFNPPDRKLLANIGSWWQKDITYLGNKFRDTNIYYWKFFVTSKVLNSVIDIPVVSREFTLPLSPIFNAMASIIPRFLTVVLNSSARWWWFSHFKTLLLHANDVFCILH